MASLKYDIPLLGRDTRFSLWQVKMRAVLVHIDLDDALDGFDLKPQASWSADEKKNDRKALSQIHIIYQIIFCKRFCRRKLLPLYG